MYWIVALLALILAACGGGGGSPSPGGASSPPPPPRTGPFFFGYYGAIPQSKIATIAPGINLLWLFQTGDALAVVQQLQAAQAQGVMQAVLDVGDYLFTYPQHAYRGGAGLSDLAALKLQLDAAGLSSMVVAIVPLDEPDVNLAPGKADTVMTQAIAGIRMVWVQPVKIAVIYGTKGPTPGIDSADWIARDDYHASASGVISELPPKRAEQSYFLVAGGADPYRQTADPFYAATFPDPRFVGFIGFTFDDYAFNGRQYAGIGSNGLLPDYQAIGCKVTGRC